MSVNLKSATAVTSACAIACATLAGTAGAVEAMLAGGQAVPAWG
jgi:hypothetical protein